MGSAPSASCSFDDASEPRELRAYRRSQRTAEGNKCGLETGPSKETACRSNSVSDSLLV